jgi:hypothetical protein
MYIDDNPNSEIRYSDIMRHMNTVRLGRAPSTRCEKNWGNRYLSVSFNPGYYQVYNSPEARQECKDVNCNPKNWTCTHLTYRKSGRIAPRGRYYDTHKKRFYLTSEGRAKAQEGRKILESLDLNPMDTVLSTKKGSINYRGRGLPPKMIEEVCQNGLGVKAIDANGDTTYIPLPKLVKVL